MIVLRVQRVRIHNTTCLINLFFSLFFSVPAVTQWLILIYMVIQAIGYPSIKHRHKLAQ